MRACQSGSLTAVKKVLSDGANVHELGNDLSYHGPQTPLCAAVRGPTIRLDVVKYLLSVGADPNGDETLPLVATGDFRRPEVLQLLIDAGGNVNGPESPSLLFLTVSNSGNAPDIVENKVRILLAEPSLRLDSVSEKNGSKTPEELAHDQEYVGAADLIQLEVRKALSATLYRVLQCSSSAQLFVADWETSGYGLFLLPSWHDRFQMLWF